MRKPGAIEEVKAGLIRRGFGRKYAARIALELEDHWRDLIDEGVRQNLSEAEAAKRATAMLGAAEPLVQEFAARLERSSWVGRHPTAAFAGLAVMGTLLWWAVLLYGAWWLSGARAAALSKSNAISPFHLMTEAVDWIRWTSYIAIPALLCWVARQWHCGWKGPLWGCLVVAIHNATHTFILNATAGHGTVSWKYSFNTATGPDWLPIVSPIVVFALIFASDFFAGMGRRQS